MASPNPITSAPGTVTKVMISVFFTARQNMLSDSAVA